MAITQSDIKSLPSSGIIPENRVPASAFAIGYSFIYTGQVDFTNPNQGFTARLVVHVENSLGQAKYVIRIEEKYNLIIFPLSPLLVLITWNWIPSAEKIEGFAFDAPIPDLPPGWDPPQLASARPMKQLGSGASFGVDPAEGSDSTPGEAIVASTFYSGIFQETLDFGDRLVVKFHNTSAGMLPSRASLLLGTEAGSRKVIDTTMDQFGALLSARAIIGGTRVQAGRAWPEFRFRDAGGSIKGREPSLVVMDTGLQVLGLKITEGFVEYFSRNDGWRWERMAYPDTARGYGNTPKVLWGPDATMPLIARIGDGRISLSVESGFIKARLVGEDVGAVTTIGPAQPGQSYSVEVTDTARVLIIDGSGKPRFESVNGGRRFLPVPEEVAADA